MRKKVLECTAASARNCCTTGCNHIDTYTHRQTYTANRFSWDSACFCMALKLRKIVLWKTQTKPNVNDRKKVNNNWKKGKPWGFGRNQHKLLLVLLLFSSARIMLQSALCATGRGRRRIECTVKRINLCNSIFFPPLHHHNTSRTRTTRCFQTVLIILRTLSTHFD